MIKLAAKSVVKTPSHTPAKSDAELLHLAQTGDFNAFEHLVVRYHAPLYRLLIGLLRLSTDAEEVLQETFLHVFNNLATFRHDSAPRSWIYRIAVNAALMRLRQKRRKPVVALEDMGWQASEIETRMSLCANASWMRQPDDMLLSDELGKHLRQAILQLPEKYRLILLLRDVEGHANEEIAQALGLTLSTVKSRLHRARLFVREALEWYFAQDDRATGRAS